MNAADRGRRTPTSAPAASSASEISRRDAVRTAALGLAAVGAAVAGGAAAGGHATQPAERGRRTQADGRRDAEPVGRAVPGGSFEVPMDGDTRVHVVADGSFTGPFYPTFAANAEEQAVADIMGPRGLDPSAAHPTAVNALLIRTPDATILIDSGTGSPQGGNGLLADHLRALGLRPGDIDAVVVTHNHGDHAGGLVNPSGREMFENAEVLMTKTERDFWLSNPSLDTSAAPDPVKQRVRQSGPRTIQQLEGRLRPVAGDQRLAPGVTLVPLPGHTPGHVGVRIESGGEELFYVTDLMHCPTLQLIRPEWYAFFDVDYRAAVATRREWFDRFASEGTRIAGTHISFPATGRLLRRAGGGYEWAPTLWGF